MADAEGLVADVLRRAQGLGFIGPGPVEPHVAHSRRFASAVPAPPDRAVDLGSGGGLPGLVLALDWPGTAWVLVEANRRRAGFLDRAVQDLGLSGRVTVDHRRAEQVGRDTQRRAQRDLVVSRAFGPPAVVAECAAPLLRVGGLLVVSEPPRPDAARWPREPLSELGLAVEDQRGGLIRLRQEQPCPSRYPRRDGVPAKRPLF